MADRKVDCPECLGVTWHDEVLGVVSVDKCGTCGGSGSIPDRRKPTANDRAVERIKAWADGMAKEPCACCQCAGNDVLVIINEEAERG